MSASETEMLPPQVQDRQPALETEMEPRPAFAPLHPGSDRLKGKQDHSGRTTALLLVGITIGILYNPITGPETTG